jgi:hypothetical protein
MFDVYLAAYPRHLELDIGHEKVIKQVSRNKVPQGRSRTNSRIIARRPLTAPLITKPPPKRRNYGAEKRTWRLPEQFVENDICRWAGL